MLKKDGIQDFDNNETVHTILDDYTRDAQTLRDPQMKKC